MRELEMQEMAAVAGGVPVPVVVEIVRAEPGFWEGVAGTIAGWLSSGSPTSIPAVGSSGIRG
jgi:hypothetical protein